MNQIICKYDLNLGGITTIQMPINAVVLDAQLQGNGICIWVLVDLIEEVKNKVFETIGTRISIMPSEKFQRKYIGTVQLLPNLVYHVFELEDIRF